jgi:hypothetical protein
MLQAVRKLGAELAARLRGLGWRGRAAMVGLCAVAVMGGLWLAAPATPPRPTAPHEGSAGSSRLGPSEPRDRAAAQARPGRTVAGISPPAQPPSDQRPADLFGSLAGQSDIWSTQQQSAMRWQIAKMAALDKLISGFPLVESASVILEPGQPRGLGSPACGPTAAVTVAMVDRAPVPAAMARAIAELVAGSIVGMSIQDVHVIDGTGRTCAVDGPATQAAEALEQQRLDEAFFADKIRQALSHLGPLVVAVSTERQGNQPRCRSAMVLAPRGGLESLWRRQGGSGGADEMGAPFAAAQLEGIRQAAARVAGLDDPRAVWADWYCDAPVQAAAAPPVSNDAPADLARDPAALAVGAGIVLATAIGAGVIVRRRRRRQAMRQLRRRQKRLRMRAGATAPGPSSLAGLLGDVSNASVAALLRDEHPQVAAVAMARLAPDRAAAVLSQMTASRQAEVAGRLASGGQLAPELVAQIEQALVDRLADAQSPGPEQARLHAAQVLSQMDAGPVLGRMGRDWPELAGSVQSAMAPLEQLMDVPLDRLAMGLRGLNERELTLALRLAGEELKSRILACLPATAGRDIRKRLSRLGPVRLGDVEMAQQRLVEAVWRQGLGRYASQSKQELLA